MEKVQLRQLVDETMQRAKVAQDRGTEALRRSDAAQVGARDALNWISEQNEQAACRADERARRRRPTSR